MEWGVVLGIVIAFGLGGLLIAAAALAAGAQNRSDEDDWLDRVVDKHGWTNLDYIMADELTDDWSEE